MSTRSCREHAMLCIASLCLAALAGCGSSIGHSTPQECAYAAKAALDSNDIEALFDCLTVETQDVLAGSIVQHVNAFNTFGRGMAALQGAKAAASIEKTLGELNSVLDKHGVDDASLQNISSSLSAVNDPQASAVVAKVVKDKRAFIADIFAAFKRLGKGVGNLGDRYAGEVKGLKVDGDKAVATIAGPSGEEHLDFRKTAAGWKLHIDAQSLSERFFAPG